MEYTYVMTPDGELYHYGTKGMKWGVRRYQNQDGSLTNAGKKRYRDARDEFDRKRDAKRREKEQSKSANKAQDTELAKRLMREELKDAKLKNEYNKLTTGPDKINSTLQKSKNVADDAAQLANKLKNVTDKSIKNQPKTRMDLSGMSDKELRDRINRELLERQYNDVFNPPTVSKGKETASKVFEVAGDIIVVAGSAAGLALSIRKLLKGGD